jgi:hypothetical protein
LHVVAAATYQLAAAFWAPFHIAAWLVKLPFSYFAIMAIPALPFFTASLFIIGFVWVQVHGLEDLFTGVAIVSLRMLQ